MAYKPLLYLNGKEVKHITAYDDLASIQDGENSGRTPTLVMDRDILGRIMSISVTVMWITKAEGMSLLNILKQPNITTKFLDSEKNDYSTMDCYCVDPQKKLANGYIDYYESISFVLNSNARYD